MPEVDMKKMRKYGVLIKDLKKELSRVVIGQEEVMNSLVKALLTNAHVLVEGVPGIAKTLLLKTLAIAVGCDFKRIQFTVDLLPTDVTGVTSYHEKKGFYVIKGPVFTNFLLADEVTGHHQRRNQHY